VVPGIGFHPVLVIIGALAENFLAHHRNAEDLADKVNHLLRSGEPVQIAVDDDPVETVIYKNEKTAEKPGEKFPGKIMQKEKGDCRWAVKRSNADREREVSTGRIFVSPTRSITSAAAPPNTTAAL